MIGPADHGKRMRLKDFDHAPIREGYRYELARGVIVVSDIPGVDHLGQLNAIQRQFYAYQPRYPGRLYGIAGASECKMMIWEWESERHPDAAVYLSPPKVDEDELWTRWVPIIAIEIVSPETKYWDYVEKPEEYLAFGMREYWIVDEDRREVLVHRRWGKRVIERLVRPPEIYKTRLLPGFQFDCAKVFDVV